MVSDNMEYKIKSVNDYSGMDAIVYFLFNDCYYYYRTYVRKDNKVIFYSSYNLELVKILIDTNNYFYKDDIDEGHNIF